MEMCGSLWYLVRWWERWASDGRCMMTDLVVLVVA